MAKKDLARPDIAYLQALRAEMEEFYDTENKQIDRMRSVRELTQSSGLPDDFRVVTIDVRDNTITDEIRETAAAMAINFPKLAVKWAKEGGEAAELNATKREHWHQALLREAGEGVGVHTYDRATDAQCGDGAAWTKVIWRKDDWGERWKIRRNQFADDVGYPDTGKSADQKYGDATEAAKQTAGKSGFVWRYVDDRNILPVWAGEEVREVLEVQVRPLSTTFRRFRLGLDAAGEVVPEELAAPGWQARKQSTCTWLEHWDDVWVTYAVAVGGKAGGAHIVQQWKHGYPGIPYFHAPGVTMSHWSNRKVGWSIGESKRMAVEYSSFLQTLHANNAAADMAPPFAIESPDNAPPLLGEDGKPVSQRKLQFGRIYQLRPGEKIAAFPRQQISQYLREQIAMNKESIQKSRMPNFAGDIGGDIGSGFAIQSVISEKKVSYKPLTNAMATMLRQITAFVEDMIRLKIKEPVGVYERAGDRQGWLALGPADLERPVEFVWDIEIEQPSAALVEGRYHGEQVQNGFESRIQAIEAQGRNPDEVRRGRLLDAFYESDFYKQMGLTEIVAQMSRGDLLQRYQAAQQQVATGRVPPPQEMGAPGSGPAGQAANPQTPDTAALSIAPNGSGARPVQDAGPGPGGIAGAPVVPQRSAAAGIQSLGS